MMRRRIGLIGTGIVLVVTIFMLISNQAVDWSLFPKPAQQALGEDDPSLDHTTILKSGEATDFLPTPLPSMTPPKEAIGLTPGQPWARDFRASPENLTRIPPQPTKDPNEPWIHDVQLDIVPLDSKQMALRSELIVLGEVVDVQSHWSTSDDKRPSNPHLSGNETYIYSITTIKIAQVLTGEAVIGDSIRLIQNGGQVGEDKLMIDDGYQRFSIGQLVVVYTNPIVHPEMGKLVSGKIYNVVERYFVDRTTQIASNPFSERPLQVILDEIQEANQIKQEIREGRFTPPPPTEQ